MSKKIGLNGAQPGTREIESPESKLPSLSPLPPLSPSSLEIYKGNIIYQHTHNAIIMIISLHGVYDLVLSFCPPSDTKMSIAGAAVWDQLVLARRLTLSPRHQSFLLPDSTLSSIKKE